MNKTVFVLGAGFSMDAGAPSQEGLIHKIFELNALKPNIYPHGFVQKFETFLSATLGIPKDIHNLVPFEDVFTPLDKCMTDSLSFRNLNVQEVKEMRDIIYHLIARTLEDILRNNNKDYIDTFATYLVNSCSKRSNRNYSTVDNVSIITTNWDILLDSSIQNFIDQYHYQNAVVDYCCHISSYDKYDERVKPGLEMLGKGGFNVKLLKLHGSLNWLQCPKCQRVYVDVQNKIVVEQHLNQIKCRHCNENFGEERSHILTSNIIMPTFLKNLSNPQYKLIWQNAGIELSEAEKIIFIGYSLPQADYEMRQLLSRMVREHCEITVVTKSNNPEKDINFIELQKRFKVFFGDRVRAFEIEGAKKYIQDKFSG